MITQIKCSFTQKPKIQVHAKALPTEIGNGKDFFFKIMKKKDPEHKKNTSRKEEKNPHLCS